MKATEMTVTESYITFDSDGNMNVRESCWPARPVEEVPELIEKRLRKFKEWCRSSGLEYDGMDDGYGTGAVYDIACGENPEKKKKEKIQQVHHPGDSGSRRRQEKGSV